MAIAYLNGEWGVPSETKVSVLDRGFMFGDGVYEVIPVYNGIPFALTAHLQRLKRSLKEVNIESPCTDAQWEELIMQGIKRSQSDFVLVYLQITRGADDFRSHVFPKKPNPTVFLMATEEAALKNRDIKSLAAVTLADYRWGKAHIKSISLLANGMLRNEAISRGVDDVLLLRDGFLTESSASNVFIVKDGIILTPPKTNYLLHGITRDHVVTLAEETQMKLQQEQISESDLKSADEIWITNSSHEVWPVGELDGELVNGGEPGPVFREMDQHFQDLKRRLCGDW